MEHAERAMRTGGKWEEDEKKGMCVCAHAHALNMAREGGSDSGKHLLGGELHPLLFPPWPNLGS